MIMKRTFSQKGFTLIEMLIVIAIIAILASVFLVGLSGFRGSAYDARRLSDLQKVQSYLELYYNKMRTYPINITAWNGSGTTLETALNGAGIGVSSIPADPGGLKYYYLSCNGGQGYLLAAGITTGSATLNDSATPDTSQCEGMVLPTTCKTVNGTTGTTLYCVSE
jgi:general secretion pathway protein G